MFFFFFFFNDTATTEIYTLSLHDALPILCRFVAEGDPVGRPLRVSARRVNRRTGPRSSSHLLQPRSEEHTSELQSQSNIVCRLLLEKKNRKVYPASVILRYRISRAKTRSV